MSFALRNTCSQVLCHHDQWLLPPRRCLIFLRPQKCVLDIPRLVRNCLVPPRFQPRGPSGMLRLLNFAYALCCSDTCFYRLKAMRSLWLFAGVSGWLCVDEGCQQIRNVLTKNNQTNLLSQSTQRYI